MVLWLGKTRSRLEWNRIMNWLCSSFFYLFEAGLVESAQELGARHSASLLRNHMIKSTLLSRFRILIYYRRLVDNKPDFCVCWFIGSTGTGSIKVTVPTIILITNWFNNHISEILSFVCAQKCIMALLLCCMSIIGVAFLLHH